MGTKMNKIYVLIETVQDGQRIDDAVAFECETVEIVNVVREALRKLGKREFENKKEENKDE